MVEAHGGQELGLGLPVAVQEPHEEQLLAGVQAEISQQPGRVAAVRAGKLEDLVAESPLVLRHGGHPR